MCSSNSVRLLLLFALAVGTFAIRSAGRADEPDDPWVGSYVLLTGEEPHSVAVKHGRYQITKQKDAYRLEWPRDLLNTAITMVETKKGLLVAKDGRLELMRGSIEFPGERRAVLKGILGGYLVKQEIPTPKK